LRKVDGGGLLGGRSTVGSPVGYDFHCAVLVSRLFGTKSCRRSASSAGVVHSRSGSYEVRRW
jgi:hypothetical protein